MLKKVLEWNVKWIEEQKTQDSEPPAVSEGAALLPLYFDSSDDYIKAFAPMLMLETWNLVVGASKPVLERKNVAENFFFIITGYEKKFNMTQYCCQAIINELSFQLEEGILCSLDVKYDIPQSNNEMQNMYTLFGYISSHKVCDPDINVFSAPCWKALDKAWVARAKFCYFNCLVKSRKYEPVLQELFVGRGICSIKNRLYLADTLGSIEHFPLCKSILYPDETTFQASPCFYPESNFNSQFSAIESIKAELQKQSVEQKILLLEGPPGTGKTHAIIGILERLMFSQGPRMKILLTASSNIALDELGSRLIELNERSSWRLLEIKFLRIDRSNRASSKMKPYTLVEKVANMSKEVDQQIKDIQEELKILNSRQLDFQDRMKVKDLLEKQAALRISEKSHNNIKNYKLNILNESNIILCPLDDIRYYVNTFKLDSVFPFSCCIVDDASQCTEPELLQVMMFGIRKLVLVGDPRQLPANVLSKSAIKCSYERSMFERFHLFFSKQNKQSPVITLTIPFRMHPEICEFPSKYFYENQLVKIPPEDFQNEIFPIPPYMIFNVEKERKSNISVSDHIFATIDICSQLTTLNLFASVGIIVPSKIECSLYSEECNQRTELQHLEINTVEEFQGREKDLIIVSCFRASKNFDDDGFLSCKKRMNVALTRARLCLIICAEVHSLTKKPYWNDLIHDAKNRKVIYEVRPSGVAELLKTIINGHMKRGLQYFAAMPRKKRKRKRKKTRGNLMN